MLAVAELAQPFEKAGSWCDDPHVACNRFDENRGNVIAILAEDGFDRRQVVVPREECVASGSGRDAGARRHAEGHRPGPGLHEEGVGVTVVAALELDDAIASRRRASNAHGAHRRLGARADEADPLHRGHQLRHTFGQPCLELGRRAEARAVGGGRRERLPKALRRVPVDERTPGHHVVDVAVAVDVLDVRPARLRDKDWCSSDTLERSYRTVDATWKDPRRVLE